MKHQIKQFCENKILEIKKSGYVNFFFTAKIEAYQNVINFINEQEKKYKCRHPQKHRIDLGANLIKSD